MIVSIEFQNGRIREYNTRDLCAADPWSDAKKGRRVVLNEFDLRLDLLQTEGTLRIDVIRHVTTPPGQDCDTVDFTDYQYADGTNPKLSVAERQPACCVLIAGKAEVAEASLISVTVAGTSRPVAWRQGSGNWLIEGTHFESARRLYYDDKIMASTSIQAVRLFRSIQRAHPEVSDDLIASAIGFPLPAIFDAEEFLMLSKGGPDANLEADGPASEGQEADGAGEAEGPDERDETPGPSEDLYADALGDDDSGGGGADDGDGGDPHRVYEDGRPLIDMSSQPPADSDDDDE